MGRDASHSNSLFQAAETVVRRLCELHSKVGSIEFLLPRPSSPPSLHDARSIFHFLLVHVMDNCCYIGLILISLEREMEGGGINLCNNIICKTNIAKRKESSSVYYYLFLVHRTLLAKTQGKCSFFSLSYACMQIPLIDSRILLSRPFFSVPSFTEDTSDRAPPFPRFTRRRIYLAEVGKILTPIELNLSTLSFDLEHN